MNGGDDTQDFFGFYTLEDHIDAVFVIVNGQIFSGVLHSKIVWHGSWAF